jgi:diaminopimelate epimerase
MTLSFTKMQGLGNDFVVIDGTTTSFKPDAALLAKLTDRRFGVGCDQVLVVDPPPSADVDFGYRIFNSDGSEVGQCGNGVRCLGRFVRNRRLSDRRKLRVRTTTSTMEIELLDDGQVRVDMGAPRFSPGEVPLHAPARSLRYTVTIDNQRVEFGAASMGNPHAVIEVADVDHAAVNTLGPRLERHELFPERANIGFLQILDREHARLRVFERGAGETLACGSGACAAMAVGRLWERFASKVEVQMRGGSLHLEWEGEGRPVYMTGPAETVFEGSLEWPK